MIPKIWDLLWSKPVSTCSLECQPQFTLASEFTGDKFWICCFSFNHTIPYDLKSWKTEIIQSLIHSPGTHGSWSWVRPTPRIWKSSWVFLRGRDPSTWTFTVTSRVCLSRVLVLRAELELGPTHPDVNYWQLHHCTERLPLSPHIPAFPAHSWDTVKAIAVCFDHKGVLLL